MAVNKRFQQRRLGLEKKLKSPITIPYTDKAGNSKEITVQGFDGYEPSDRSVGIMNSYVYTSLANITDNHDHEVVIFDSGEIQLDDRYIGMCDPTVLFGDGEW